jgi:hypothetical protein
MIPAVAATPLSRIRHKFREEADRSMPFGDGKGFDDMMGGGPVRTAANDNGGSRCGAGARSAFINSSSKGATPRDAAACTVSTALRGRRNLRPTDLFNDLWEDADGLRAPVPLCAKHRRVRADK